MSSIVIYLLRDQPTIDPHVHLFIMTASSYNSTVPAVNRPHVIIVLIDMKPSIPNACL